MEKIFREEEVIDKIESIYPLADDYYIVLKMIKKYGYGPPGTRAKRLIRPLNQVAQLLTEIIHKKNNEVQQLSLITLKDSLAIKENYFNKIEKFIKNCG